MGVLAVLSLSRLYFTSAPDSQIVQFGQQATFFKVKMQNLNSYTFYKEF